jgi:hypothetical protein
MMQEEVVAKRKWLTEQHSVPDGVKPYGFLQQSLQIEKQKATLPGGFPNTIA